MNDPRIQYEARMMNHCLDLWRGLNEDVENPTPGALFEAVAFTLTATYVGLVLGLPETADDHFRVIVNKCVEQLVTFMDVAGDREAEFRSWLQQFLSQRTQEYDSLRWDASSAPAQAVYFAFRKHIRDALDTAKSMKAMIAIPLVMRDLNVPAFVLALQTTKYGVHSSDGRWWWDGNRWQPMAK
jgi:hypothetical protein